MLNISQRLEERILNIFVKRHDKCLMRYICLSWWKHTVAMDCEKSHGPLLVHVTILRKKTVQKASTPPPLPVPTCSQVPSSRSLDFWGGFCPCSQSALPRTNSLLWRHEAGDHAVCQIPEGSQALLMSSIQAFLWASQLRPSPSLPTPMSFCLSLPQPHWHPECSATPTLGTCYPRGSFFPLEDVSRVSSHQGIPGVGRIRTEANITGIICCKYIGMNFSAFPWRLESSWGF